MLKWTQNVENEFQRLENELTTAENNLKTAKNELKIVKNELTQSTHPEIDQLYKINQLENKSK